MSEPAVSEVGAVLYASVAPLAYADGTYGWPLLYFCDAVGRMLQPVDDYARDIGGDPGWSLLLDVERTPGEALGYLAQFVGITLPAGLTDALQRERIRQTDGFKRGSFPAFAAAPLPYLTGSRTVVIRERDSSPYHVTAITFTSETPDSAAVEAALIAQKPAGLVLNYVTMDGQDFEHARDTYATFADLKAAYSTFDDMRTDHP